MSRLFTAEKDASSSIVKARDLAAAAEARAATPARATPGSSLFLPGDAPAVQAAPVRDEGDSALYLDPAAEAKAIKESKALMPGARRKRFRQLIDSLRAASVRRSANRRLIATEAAEVEHRAELDAAALRVDAAEAEVDLQAIQQTQDGAGDIGGQKQLLDFEAEACETERAAAAEEYWRICVAWKASDDKVTNGRHTKAYERRAYLVGHPVVTDAATFMPAGFGGDVGAFEAHTSGRDTASRRLKKLNGNWTKTDEKKEQASLRRVEKASSQARKDYFEAHPRTVKWPEPGEELTGTQGHLGMLSSRASTARRIAAEQPSPEQRTALILNARAEVAAAKGDLARLQGDSADTQAA